MATQTTNYSLEKPDAVTEYYDINIINENMNKIDAALAPTADPALAPIGNGPGKLSQWVSWITNRLKAITGKANWWDAPTQSLEDLNTTVNEHLAENATLTEAAHVKHGVLTATLDTNWTGSSAPFTKSQAITGILATDTPIIDVVMSGTYATDDARQKAWSKIYRVVTGVDSITLYASVKPTVALPIQLKVVR
jgi:hypothetical protein